MIEIIATAAVSGLLGLVAGMEISRPLDRWTIRRDIERDLVRNRLRKSCEEHRLEVATLQQNAIQLHQAIRERDEARKERDAALCAIAAAGKPDTQAVSDYMREIGARGNASPARLSNRKRSAASQREAA